MSDTKLTSFAESLSLKSSRNGFLEGISCKLYVFHFLNLIVRDEDVLYIKYIRTSQSKKDGSTGIHVPFTVLYAQKGLNPAVDIIYI